MTVQRNSFISLMEDISILNKNIVEVVAKLNTVVASSDSSVQFTMYKNNGSESTFNMPTVGYLKTQIDNLNNNMKRISGFNDGTSLIIDGKSVKRIFATDLNNEPSPLSTIQTINSFEPVNNHFFESLINPLLSVNVDLTDKVNDNVNGVLARRYIVKFERNQDNSLTSNGITSYNDYITKFSNRTDIGISEFTDWYYNSTNYGVIHDTVQPYDEQQYDLSLKKLSSHGVFSVLKTEVDSINKKYWYHLNTLNYYNIDGTSKNLSIGDELILNKVDSSTRWKIKEVSVEDSLNKVVLERVDGFEPVPVATNILKFYSDVSSEKSVKINVGFDEHNILFIKPINTMTNLVSNIWSKGVSFFTNDLMLSTNQNVRLSEYYINTVYDYGKLLEDMVLKKIPSAYGTKPNNVTLNVNNFKVVQINDHLTNSRDMSVLKDLQSQKISSKTKLSEYDSAIIQKNQEVNSNLTVAERVKVQNELQRLYTEQESETKNLSSIVSKISSQTNTDIAAAKFRVRGFWSIPDPIISTQTQPQHVVQFKIQYRYSSKDGRTPNINSFNYNQSSSRGTTDNNVYDTTQAETTNVSSTSEYVDTDTAYFSSWVEIVTDVRKRYWDEVLGNWYWKIEDVADADTPNINQLDIPIQKNEKVEIRIKSISEVGWPDSILESDWSSVLTVTFPDNLNDVLNENQFILEEATMDSTLVSVNNELNAKGVYTHIKDSFYDGQVYYPHTDRSISVTFKDDNGDIMTLYDYLLYLTNKVSELESLVKSAKGELKVMLYWSDINDNIKSIEIKNNDTKTINVQCEDYGETYIGTILGTSTTSKLYTNDLILIDDYYLSFENLSGTNPLGLLSGRLYSTSSTYNNTFYQYEYNKAVVLDQNNGMFTQQNNQFIWFSDNSLNEMIYSASTFSVDTQINVLKDVNYNYGYSGTTDTDTPFGYITDIAANANGGWKSSTLSGFTSTVHPRVNQMSDLIDTGQSKIKAVNKIEPFRVDVAMYFKFDISDTDYYQVPSDGSNRTVHTKKLKCFLEPENLSRPFEFELRFKLNRYKNYTVGSISAPTSSSDGN